jgi:hypothetical protein
VAKIVVIDASAMGTVDDDSDLPPISIAKLLLACHVNAIHNLVQIGRSRSSDMATKRAWDLEAADVAKLPRRGLLDNNKFRVVRLPPSG